MKVAGKWVSPPYDADGWRLDVAADLGYSEDFNHRFWRDFRRSVKSAKKDAIILAEHYGDPSPWLMGDQWDTVMNYDAFMEPVTWFLTGMEKHSDDYNEHLLNNASAFFQSMLHNMCCFSAVSYTHLMEAVLALADKQVGREIHLPCKIKASREYGCIRISRGLKSESAGEWEFIQDIFPYDPSEKIPENRYTKWFDYDKIVGRCV